MRCRKHTPGQEWWPVGFCFPKVRGQKHRLGIYFTNEKEKYIMLNQIKKRFNLNRVKTRLDVIRYQLSVIGFDKILIKIVSHLNKEYSFAKGVKTNNH